MKSRQTLLCIFLTCTLSSLAQWQRWPQHSLAMGIETSLAVVTGDEITTPALTLHLNYQRNFARWFSPRTSLLGGHFFPAKTARILGPPGHQVYVQSALGRLIIHLQKILIHEKICLYHWFE